ncbi:metacaspase-1-like [Xenia sp. Carnegie-2017]|uniref:metacaspase-1-like n=1 Tax=Xenia sp. Carnegie-2017 TaxID=2897299 RepID=UPI001F038CAA|nr:metacaspase-1-like [Xenia sp. Carnegie-2017]
MEQPPRYLNEKSNPTPHPVQQQSAQNQDYPPPDYTPQGYTLPDYTPQGYTLPDNTPQGYTLPDYTPQGYTLPDYTPQGYTLPDYTPQDYTLPDYTPQGYTQKNYSLQTVAENQPQPAAETNPVINDHMTLSIVSFLCCCWPIGIFAIIKSREARNRSVAGDYEGAIASAYIAKNLAVIAIVCSIVCFPLLILFLSK